MQRLNPEARQKLFDQICEFAIAGKRRLLGDLLRTNQITIAFTVRECTPVRHLAMLGYVSAVNFLIERFNANPFEALLGYTLANNALEAQNLVAEGERNFAYALSLGRAGNLEAILELGDKLNDTKYRVLIATGLALGGHVDKVHQLPFAGAYHIIHSYIYGLAFSKQKEELNKELQLGAKKYVAVWGYAAAGASDEVEEFLFQIKENEAEDYKLACNSAALAYATSGYVELAEDMITRGVDISWMICGFANAGMKYKVDELLKAGAKKSEAIKGYLKAHSPNEALQLYALDNNPYSVILAYKDVSWGELNNEYFLNILAHVSDSGKHNDSSFAENFNQRLMVQSHRLNILMQTYYLDYHAAKHALAINAQPRIKTWLLQGIQISQNRNQGLPVIPFDIYLRISALVINLPIAEVKKIFDMVNDFLLIEVVSNKSKYHQVTSTIFSFFGQPNFEQSAGIRHQERRLAWL